MNKLTTYANSWPWRLFGAMMIAMIVWALLGDAAKALIKAGDLNLRLETISLLWNTVFFSLVAVFLFAFLAVQWAIGKENAVSPCAADDKKPSPPEP